MFLLMIPYITSTAQGKISGVVRDSLTKAPLSFVTVAYEGLGIGTITDDDGAYTIPVHTNKKEISYTAVGYRKKNVRFVPGQTLRLDVLLAPSDVVLEEVVVKKQKEKYSRKDNPAVELMKKVINHKSLQKLEERDFYQYDKYQKLTTSLNDVKLEELDKGLFKKIPFLVDQLEVCSVTNKMIAPISYYETASQVFYRKDPKSEKTIIKGEKSSGVQELFSTGDMVGEALTDVFADINIYDNDIRLLQNRFVSPISDGAISFYQYFIVDTVKVENDSCYHLFFRPNNPQDFGFIGHLYVLKDSTYAVKRCTMNLPIKTAVNFVENMEIIQSFERFPDGTWGLKDDDMIAELYLLKQLQGLQIRRTTHYSQYSFDGLPPSVFKLKGNVIKEVDALMKDDDFWSQIRPEPLTSSESGMSAFINQLTQVPGVKGLVFVLKALIENFIETGTKDNPSKFDFGPMNATAGYNKVEGWRFRVGGQTTANLHPQLFLRGYYAYGLRDKESKYSAQVEYSFLKKEYLNREFPKHYVSLAHTYDLTSFSDRFLRTSKDNMFVGIKASSTDQMSYIRESEFKYEQETYSGFSYVFSLKKMNDRPTGSLVYIMNDPDNTIIREMNTSEAQLALRFAPGETFVNSKERRIPVNLDAPVFTLSHTTGIDNFLGSEYASHLTQVGIFKRFWLSSWGKFDISLSASKQWNKVPFPLLITPPSNLSYIIQKGTFSLVNNLEFIGDEFVMLDMSYNLNGKLFNRIPLLKELKWREVIGFKAFTGRLTEKNDPMRSDGLFYFPTDQGEQVSFPMQKKPYMELSLGIHNILKFIHIEYVRRINYLDNPNINKHGFRIAAMMQF